MNDFLKKLKWIHICVIITMMSQSLVYGQGVVNDQTAGRHLAPKSQIESMLDEGRSRDDKKKAETILTLLDQEEFQGIRDLIRQRQPKILQSEDMYEVEAQVTEFLVNEMERGNPMQDAILSEKAEYAVYKDFRKEAGLEQTGREASLAGRTGRVAEYESHYSKRRTAYESIFVKSPDSQENDGGLNAATADRFFTVLDNAMLYHQFFQALLTLPIELKGRQALRFERDRGRRESRLITVIINAVQKIREANQELGEQAVLISQEVLGDIILKGVKARNTEAAELIEELEALQRKLPGGEKEADYEAARQAAELADIHIREIQGVVRNEDGKIQDLLINSAQIIEIKTQIQTWRTALSTNEREQQQYAGVQSEEAVAAMGTLNEAHQTLSGLITSLEASLTALMQTGNEFNDAHRQSRTSVGLYDEQIRQAYSLAEKYQGSPDGSRELAVFEKAQEALQALEKEQQNLLWLDQLGSKLTGLYFNLSMTFEAQAALDEQFNQAYYALLETSFMRETAEQTAQEVKKRLDALSAWFANSLPFHGIAEGINPLDETTPQITDLLNHLYGPDMATANPDIHRAAQDLLLNYEAVVLQPFMAVREREIAFWGSTAHAPVEIAPAFVSLFQEAGITVVPMEDNKVQMDYPHCLDDAVAYLVQMNRLITEAQGLFVEGNLPQENVEKYNELVSMYTVLAQGGINLLNSIIFSIRFRSFSPEVIQMKAEARPIAVNLLEEFSRRLAEITQITDRQGIQPPTVESPSPLPQEPAEPTVQPSSDTSTAEPAPAGEPGTPLPAESPIAEPEIPIDVVIDAAVDTAQTLADEETQADQQGGTGARARVRNLIWRILGGAGIVLLCIAIPAGVIAGPAAGGVAVWLTSNTVFVFLLVAFAAALLFYIASYIKFKKLPSLRGLLGSMFLGSVAGGIVIGLIKLYAAYPIIGAILIGVAVLFILWLLGVEKGLWRILSKYVFTRANLKRLIFVVAAIAIGASLGVGGLTVWNLWAMNKAFSIGMGAALAGILILTGIAYFKTSETPPDWMGRIGRGSLWLAKKSVTLGLIGLIGFGVFKVYAAGGILAALGVGAPALLVAIALVFGISGLRTFFRGIGRFFRGVSNVISWKGAVILLGSFGVPLFLGWVAITHASILPFLGLAILGAAVLFLLWKYLGFSRTLFVLSAAALLTTIFVLWSIPSWYLVPVLAVVLLAAILWDYFKISDAIRKSSPWVKFGLALTAIGAPIALLVALGLPQAPPAGTGEEGGAKVTMSSAARKQIAERQAEETKAAFEQSAQQLPDLGIPGYTSPPPEKANYAGNIILTFLEDNGFPENPESPELEDFLDGIDNHIRTGGTFNHTPGDDNSVDNKLTSFRSQLEANNLAPDVVEQAVDALEIYLNQHVQDEAPAPAPDVTPSPDQPAPPTAAPTPDQPPAPEAAPAPAAPVVKKIVTYAPTDLTDAQTAEAVSAINTIQAESNSSSKPVLNNYLNILKGDMEASNNKGQGLYEDLRHFEDNRETWKLWVQQNLRLARDKGEISEDEMINLKAELFGILGKLPVPNRYVKTVTVNAPADGTAGPAAGTTTARTPRAKAPADTAAQAAAAARVITEGAAEANAQEAAPQPAQPVVARVVSPTGADSTATAPATEPEAKPLSYAQLEKLRQEALNTSIPALVLQIRDILIPDLQIE
ncbi:MAG: hypothetical protein JW774_07455, partial [Candidatus Aureabacteria bacterium]|nr:hypothetical protein [Candidatus Auribacterota bacterium]